MTDYLTTPDAIWGHYKELRRYLPRDITQAAELLGCSTHNIHQFGWIPSTRGAKTIPVETLDTMRVVAIEAHLEKLHRGRFPFKIESYGWNVEFIANEVFFTVSRSYAVYLAGCFGADVFPHPENTKAIDQGFKLSEKEELAMRWLTATRCSDVSYGDLQEITGLGEYDVGRVGLVWLQWGIEPERSWVENLESRNQEARHAA